MNTGRPQNATCARAPCRTGGRVRILRKLIAACGLMLLAMTSGCGGLPGKSQSSPHHTYLLQGSATPQPAVVSGASRCLSLRVSVPAAAPGYGTARMAYTREPQRLDYFAFHEWVDAPARMIGAAIGTRLDASGLLGSVVTGSSDVRTDLRLDSELQRLQQDFGAADSSVGLSIKVSLVDVLNRQLLNSKTFSYVERADGGNPEAGVAAANRAVDRFLAELTGFVAGSIAKLECPAQS
jgi:cholesterol transport system auxiliary component